VEFVRRKKLHFCNNFFNYCATEAGNEIDGMGEKRSRNAFFDNVESVCVVAEVGGWLGGGFDEKGLTDSIV
jgi:hypothetical protein